MSTSDSSNNTLSPAIADTSKFGMAFQRCLPEIAAVAEDQLIPVNIEVYGAVVTVIGTLGEIHGLRDRIAKLPDIDQAAVDKVEDYARAAGEANSRYVTATAPQEAIAALNDEAVKIRETMRLDTLALAHRGLIDPARLAAFKGLTGYKNVGFDLIEYVNILKDCWPKIYDKTAFTEAEVQHAKDVGERLVDAVGLREQGPAVVAEVARLRQQAFTLMVESYDEVRRAVTFLRWNEGDADTITPSLYAGRARPAKGSQNAAPTAPATPPVATPTTGNGAAAVVHSPGMPGTSPLAS